jgi:hypothetical protein
VPTTALSYGTERDGGKAMLIALLVALGVDLVAVFVLGRRRWVKRQPGEFAGAIRVPDGAIEGLSRARRSSGYSHHLCNLRSARQSDKR